MEVTLILIGKTCQGYLLEGEGVYNGKLKHYTKFSEEIITFKKGKQKDKTILKKTQGKEILRRLKPSDIVVLLDEKGKKYSSVAFSNFLKKQLNSGCKRLVFVVGGAYGFSQEMHERAHHLVSLSPMTFSHQMVRLIFKEQLYRVFSILKGEPYHHE